MSVGEHAICRNTGLFYLATQTYSNMTKNLLIYVLVNFVCHTVHFLVFSILTNKIEACIMVVFYCVSLNVFCWLPYSLCTRIYSSEYCNWSR